MLQGYVVMGAARTFGVWALQGYFAVGHCKDTWWLGSAGTICGWARQGQSAVGPCRDSWWLGTAVGHRRDALQVGTAVRLWPEGGDNIDFKI